MKIISLLIISITLTAGFNASASPKCKLKDRTQSEQYRAVIKAIDKGFNKGPFGGVFGHRAKAYPQLTVALENIQPETFNTCKEQLLFEAASEGWLDAVKAVYDKEAKLAQDYPDVKPLDPNQVVSDQRSPIYAATDIGSYWRVFYLNDGYKYATEYFSIMKFFVEQKGASVNGYACYGKYGFSLLGTALGGPIQINPDEYGPDTPIPVSGVLDRNNLSPKQYLISRGAHLYERGSMPCPKPTST